MDKVELGRRGEIFVMRKLMDDGWEFPENFEDTLEGSDWVLKKGDRQIKLQVKTSVDNKYFSVKGKRKFDYLVFTDLNDLWVIPVEMLKLSAISSKIYNKLKNKTNLLEFEKKELLAEINDCGVRFSELDTSAPFFEPKMQKGGNSLKLSA